MVSDSGKRTGAGMLEDILDRLGLVERRLALQPEPFVLPGRLGATVMDVPGDDVNLALESGWYVTTPGDANQPQSFTDYWLIEVRNAGGRSVQFARPWTADQPKLTRFRNVPGDGLFQPWLREDGILIPTGLSGGTFDAETGEIDLTVGAAGLTFDCTNDSRFNRWRVDYYYYTGGTADGNQLRLRTGGADITTSNEYHRPSVYGQGTTNAQANYFSGDRIPIAATSGQAHHGWFELGNVKAGGGLTRQKVYEGVNTTDISNDAMLHWSGWLGGNDAVAITGFTFSQSSGSPPGFNNGRFVVRGLA